MTVRNAAEAKAEGPGLTFYTIGVGVVFGVALLVLFLLFLLYLVVVTFLVFLGRVPVRELC